MITFRFFSDSWFWSWGFHNSPTHQVFIRSAAVRKKLCCDPNSNTRTRKLLDIGAISFYEMLFEKIGHRAVRQGCQPGQPFTETVDIITAREPLSVNGEVNVVFYSDDLRGCDLHDLLLNNSNQHVNEIERMLDDITVDNLNRLGKFAEDNNQHYLLLGGQGTLFRETFNKCSHTKNLHLLSECALWEHCDTAKTVTHVRENQVWLGPPRWKLVDAVPVGATTPDYENMHETVVNKIYTDREIWMSKTRHATFPDLSHPGPAVCVFITDRIVKYVEDNPHVAGL